jgi:hypothetical protein
VVDSRKFSCSDLVVSSSTLRHWTESNYILDIGYCSYRSVQSVKRAKTFLRDTWPGDTFVWKSVIQHSFIRRVNQLFRIVRRKLRGVKPTMTYDDQSRPVHHDRSERNSLFCSSPPFFYYVRLLHVTFFLMKFLERAPAFFFILLRSQTILFQSDILPKTVVCIVHRMLETTANR